MGALLASSAFFLKRKTGHDSQDNPKPQLPHPLHNNPQLIKPSYTQPYPTYVQPRAKALEEAARLTIKLHNCTCKKRTQAERRRDKLGAAAYVVRCYALLKYYYRDALFLSSSTFATRRTTAAREWKKTRLKPPRDPRPALAFLTVSAVTLVTMSFFGIGRPQPTSAEKIAAVEQEMKLMASMHNRMIQMCTKKCLPSDYREGELNKGESVCLDRCAAKFFEAHTVVSTQLEKESQNRGGPAAGGGFGFGG